MMDAHTKENMAKRSALRVSLISSPTTPKGLLAPFFGRLL
jgi:hypothetical protein